MTRTCMGFSSPNRARDGGAPFSPEVDATPLSYRAIVCKSTCDIQNKMCWTVRKKKGRSVLPTKEDSSAIMSYKR